MSRDNSSLQLEAQASAVDCPRCENKIYTPPPRYSPEMELRQGMILISPICRDHMRVLVIEGAGRTRVVQVECIGGIHRGGKYVLAAPTNPSPSVRSDLWRGWEVEK